MMAGEIEELAAGGRLACLVPSCVRACAWLPACHCQMERDGDATASRDSGGLETAGRDGDDGDAWSWLVGDDGGGGRTCVLVVATPLPWSTRIEGEPETSCLGGSRALAPIGS